MNKAAQICENAHDERIKKFNFPKWLEISCPACSLELLTKHIQSVEISFTPSFLGDLCFSYHCEHCHSLICMHLKCDISSIENVSDVLNLESNPYEFVIEEDLVKSHRHNVFDSLQILD